MRNNSVDQAVDYRDGMAKVYHVLFVIFLNFTLHLTGWVFLAVLCVKLCWCIFPPKLNPNSSELQLLFFFCRHSMESSSAGLFTGLMLCCGSTKDV